MDYKEEFRKKWTSNKFMGVFWRKRSDWERYTRMEVSSLVLADARYARKVQDKAKFRITECLPSPSSVGKETLKKKRFLKKTG